MTYLMGIFLFKFVLITFSDFSDSQLREIYRFEIFKKIIAKIEFKR